jgi:hypothetical protein
MPKLADSPPNVFEVFGVANVAFWLPDGVDPLNCLLGFLVSSSRSVSGADPPFPNADPPKVVGGKDNDGPPEGLKLNDDGAWTAPPNIPPPPKAGAPCPGIGANCGAEVPDAESWGAPMPGLPPPARPLGFALIDLAAICAALAR